MHKRLENQVSMMYAVKEVCEAHTATWTGNVPFTNAFTDLKAKLSGIEVDVSVQETKLTGVATDKRKKSDLMLDSTFVVAQATLALATDTSDAILKAKVNFTRSGLAVGRDSVVAQRCEAIHTTAGTVAAALIPYGVTAAQLTALQTNITAYVTVLSAPRAALTIRKGATAEITKEVGDAMAVLHDRMDAIMPAFKTASPHFFQEYFDARIIVDSGMPDLPKPPPAPPTP